MSRFVIDARVAPGGHRIAVRDAVVVDDDGEGEVVPAARALPGFVDLHCHGALGFDFGSCSVDEARAAADFHLERGATAVVASVATAPLAEMRAAIVRLRALVAEGVLAGIHLEGPYLSERRRGAHAPSLLRVPERAEIRDLLDAGEGAVRVVTIAPELPGAIDAIPDIVAAGAVAAAGHTDATAEEMRAAVEAGVRLVTHAFNGMRPLHHRDPGPLAVALADERVVLELILDGHHVADEIVELVRRLAPGRLALVSDAMSATGCADGRYEVAGSEVEVAGGIARAVTDGSLAGSTTPLGDAVDRFVSLFAPSIDEVAAVSSRTASRLLRLPDPLTPGASADIVLDLDGGERRVVKNGEFAK
ncbi:N-acetylglucosamine-6-phosphate deacetylase [Microbacterium sp. RURRCA19A]|uniref:N-acetylglucosamine-6-phosphate deacetylase n=1 Tax=Microbacterium sp. RURRCA19A TaxID=1907391 RepID=UPI00095678E7|nr:amidohydrolase family protein [Microbacterium sp. RURRCA19A]SIR96741.1 N-acetylglucosamine-6-phosphate deacetylase [Microbacterium sp. RURRCA19A]